MIVKEGGTSYTFVIDGIESALAQAKAAAATKDVVVMGGANIARQLCGSISCRSCSAAGTRLLDDLGPEPVGLEPFEVVNTPQVTHLRYRFSTPPRPAH